MFLFAHSSQQNDFILWKMKEYGVEESWTQLFKTSYEKLSRHCFKDCLHMVCLYKNGDMAIFANEFEHHEVIYNLRNKKVEKIRVNGWIYWFFHENVYVECWIY